MDDSRSPRVARALTLTLVFALLLASTAYPTSTLVVNAADAVPPEILHVPVTDGVALHPISIYVLVTDDVQVAEVTLYYRRADEDEYTRMAMPPCASCIDAYNATIPGSEVTSTTIAYYVNASDGPNVALEGSSATPHLIRINADPSPVVVHPPSDVASDAMTLTWTENLDPDFANYTIYQSTGQGDPSAIHAVTLQSTTSYRMTGLTPATTYHFTVRVYDTGGLHADAETISGTTSTLPDTPFPWLYAIAGILAIGAIAVIVTLVRGR